jgi:hypothetical protein
VADDAETAEGNPAGPGGVAEPDSTIDPSGAAGTGFAGAAGEGSYAQSSEPARDFDQLTRGMAGLLSRRSALLGGAAVISAVVAWFIWGRGGSECSTGSRCGDRHYCNEEETCICTETTEGDLRCGQIPSYCNVPLCTTSADCAHLGEGWFCDVPHSGCCTDPPAELSRCIAPCGSEYPPPPAATTTTAPPDETEEPDEQEELEDDGEPAHLRRTASQEDGLLFFSRWEDGSGAYFYGEVGRADTLQLTHVVFEDRRGTTAAVVINEDLLPVSWVAPRVSIAARSEARHTALDPTDALHAVIIDAEETVHRIDLMPTDFRGVVRRGEAITGERYTGAQRAVMEAPTEWGALVEAARVPGPEQPQRLANALGLSIAHAALALLEATGEVTDDQPSEPDDDSSPGAADPEGTDELAAGATRHAGPVPLGAPPTRGRSPAGRSVRLQIPGSAVMGPFVESMVKSALINAGLEELFGPKTPTDPNAPTVDLLLCQGATSWGTVCHYVFFSADDIMGCLDFCKTDLACFNNICMPTTLSVDDARGGW